MSKNSFADLYPSAWKGTADRSAVMAFAKDYREFVSRCKTERETAAETVRAAREAGFRDLDELCAAVVSGIKSAASYIRGNLGR